MSDSPFDHDAIRALAGILLETGLTEIEIENGDTRVRVARAVAPVQASVAPPAAAAPNPVPAATAAATALDPAQHPGAILSPMVGVVYLAPEPGAAPFVAVGHPVITGQTVLLIEAMKTFNQIKAPRDGVVSRILVAAGSPVEYDEPLMIVE